MKGHAHLLVGLAIGWLTAPLLSWLAHRARSGRDADADADAGDNAGHAGSAAPARSAAAAPTCSSAARGPAAAAAVKQQHPSLEHALASAGAGDPPPSVHFPNGNSTTGGGNNTGENNGGGDNSGGDNSDASAAATAAPLDFASPESLAALFGGGRLAPLRTAHDGRPLVAFDLEATGLSVARDRVVEIAAVKVHPDGRVETKRHLLNPGREAALRMPAAVVDIHGLTPAALAREPRFEDVAAEWRDFLRGCDLCGYNALRYDVPLLRAEFKRSGHPNFPPHGVRVLDGFRVFSRMAPRSLPAAVRVFCGGAAMRGHHSALADAAAALAVVRGQLAAYPGLPRDAAELAQFCASPDDPGRQLTWCGRIAWDDGASPLAVEAATAAEAEAEAAAAAAAGGASGRAAPPAYYGPPPPLEAAAVFAFGKYRDVTLRAVAEEDREYLLWLVARREALSEEAAAIVAAALRGDFPRKGAGFAAWLARAMERLAPGVEGILGAGGGEEVAPHPGGTEGAEVARWTGEGAGAAAGAAAVTAAGAAGAAAAATAAPPTAAAGGDGEGGAAGPSSAAPPPPPLPRHLLGSIPATVCHLPGDFEYEAPAAGARGYGGSGRSGGGGRDRHRRPRRRFGDDDGHDNLTVKAPAPVVRGWEEARKAYLGDDGQGGKGLQAAEATAAAAAAVEGGGGGGGDDKDGNRGGGSSTAVHSAAGAAATAEASPSPSTPPPPAPAAPPPALAGSGRGGGGDSWGSPSARAPRSEAAGPEETVADAAAFAAEQASSLGTAPPSPEPPLAAAPPSPSAAGLPPPPTIGQASLDWGRYKGRPLAEVAAEDPAFLFWVVESLGASAWDRYAATAALREAGELPPPADDDSVGDRDGGEETGGEEEEDAGAREEGEADAEEQRRQAAATE